MKTTLVFLAAGFGSRFGGGVKQIEPVGPNGEVLMDYAVHDALRAGFDRVVFIIRRDIEAEFRSGVGRRVEAKCDVDYVFQELSDLPASFSMPEGRKKPWGTGHAILCCKDLVDQPFAAVNADDFYGPSAYQQINHYLAQQTGDYCMVGFRLKNTLTDNGTVSRGVCKADSNGHLLDIQEITDIAADKNKVVLPADTIVSMNMWGFTPDLFGYLEEGFHSFLTEKIEQPKAEFFLPFQIDELIKDGRKQVKVLVAEDKWYGMTYREDKPVLKAAIAAMTEKGLYQGI